MDIEQAREQLDKAVEKTAKSAQEHLDRGVHPEAVALHLASMTDGLSDGVKVSAVKQTVAGMSPEARQKLLAELQAAENATPSTS